MNKKIFAKKLISLVFIKKTSSNQKIPQHQNDINVEFMCNEGKQINQSIVVVMVCQNGMIITLHMYVLECNK